MANNKEKKVLNVPNSKDRGNVIRNVPALRFPEFTDEWKKIRLDSFTERVMRKNKNNLSKLPLTISAQYGLVDQITFFNKVVASTDMSNYYLLKKGEFAYNKSYSSDYPWGAIKRLDNYEQGALSSLYICFAPKDNVETDFILQYFESPKWHKGVSEIAVEGARNHGLLNISVQDFFHTHHYMPKDKKEQAKIAKLLMFLDERIATQNKIIERYESLIRGLNDSLYDQYGDDVLTSFSSLGLSYSGLSGKSAQDFGSGKPYITYLNVYSNNIINEKDFQYVAIKEGEKQNVVEYGDVLFTLSSETPEEVGIGSVYLGNENVYLNSFCFGIHIINTKIAFPPYLSYYVSSTPFRKFIYPYAQGSTRFNLCKAGFEKASIKLPSLENQKRIYSILSRIEGKTETEKSLLDLYNSQKQYLLRQMFI